MTIRLDNALKMWYNVPDGIQPFVKKEVPGLAAGGVAALHISWEKGVENES